MTSGRTKISFRTEKSHSKRRLLGTGLAMGTADLVPGVSGGTIAFLFGIYEELLFSIKQVTGNTLKLLAQRKFLQAFRSIPFGFLLPLVAGIGLAIFGLANLMQYLLEEQGQYVWSLFFGLIIGSIIVLRKKVTYWRLSSVFWLIVGAAFVFFVTGLTTAEASSNPLTLFLSGAVAICAMILPGISGSLILLILGQYEQVLAAVAERDLGLLFFVAAGAVVGLALFTRLLMYLLKTHNAAVMALLVGMLVGSLRAVWPWRENATGDPGADDYSPVVSVLPALNGALLVCVVLIVVGLLLVLQLERLGLTKEHTSDIESSDFKDEVRVIEKNK